jgi:hypothetical protein
VSWSWSSILGLLDTPERIHPPDRDMRVISACDDFERVVGTEEPTANNTLLIRRLETEMRSTRLIPRVPDVTVNTSRTRNQISPVCTKV